MRKAHQSELGARLLRRIIQKFVREPLVEYLLK
jgi:ATP-dependent Clp protease ATP-binding subunit ClpA